MYAYNIYCRIVQTLPNKHVNSLILITLTKGARACYVGKVRVVTLLKIQAYGYQSIKFM